ncbi:hypothetical protein FAES_3258 [Fibrella aestuarina BUZ 2]|uniref:Uncharacterized protein n=1 Tax=Fibrella aestuarina BUZ 2 TaxID=1166018 RepID=I0KAW4_9BACT|nr:hypothetical protein [Fibrella aestuarina]CCH01267.1 hypothetical protein FAES_3258 [Fibrella aestuarina BUZ 2]
MKRTTLFKFEDEFITIVHEPFFDGLAAPFSGIAHVPALVAWVDRHTFELFTNQRVPIQRQKRVYGALLKSRWYTDTTSVLLVKTARGDLSLNPREVYGSVTPDRVVRAYWKQSMAHYREGATLSDGSRISGQQFYQMATTSGLPLEINHVYEI